MAQAQVAKSRPRPPQNPNARLNDGAYGQYQSSVNAADSFTTNSAPFASKNTGGWQPYPSPDVSYQSAQYYQPLSSQSSPNENNFEESRIQQLALQYRNAESGKKESINLALTHFLTELFDARHKAQSSRVEALKNEVQQTQELLDKRLQNKSKIIERRVKELTGQQDELSWNASVPVANSMLPGIENSPLQTPVQKNGFNPGNNTVPYAPVNNYSPTNTNPLLFTAPSGILPSAQPVEVAQTLPVFDNAPGKTFRTSDLSVNESLPTLNANATVTPGPVSASPASNNPVNGPLESQRSFMNIGFKLKGLMRQKEEEQSIKGLEKVKSEIEETKSVWEFEKSSLESELESAESEYQLVTKQLEQSKEQLDIQKAKMDAGASSDAQFNYSKAEVTKSEVERQLLQLRSRMTTIKKSIDWMENFFKEKTTSPPSTAGEPGVLPPAY